MMFQGSGNLGKMEFIWGNAASPILHGDLCILWVGPGENQVLLAVNKKTGETVWEHDEKGGSWSTPLIVNVNGQDQYYGSDKRFQGIQLGLAIPIWVGPHNARTKAAGLAIKTAQKQQEEKELIITQQYNQAYGELTKNRNSIYYYRTSALATADLLTRQSRKAFSSGELDYTSLLLHLRQALNIREGYLEALYHYNQSMITIHYLNGSK
jgi:cobalt-zinc-cadmium resistance protein CzcA